MTLTVVIPTKNRRDDLRNAIVSLVGQSRPVDELIIVDQGADDESRQAVEQVMADVGQPRLLYIHDTSVKGLVDAKRVGSARATGDIVCFLEDDVILEPAYIEEIARAFASRPDIFGCSGVISNLPWTAGWYVAAHRAFFRGIFHDPRVRLSLQALNGAAELIPCDVLSGGVSCWRREVFARVPFDVINGFFLFEDMEFSTRVVRAFGHHLYINPRARLLHVGSPVNRDIHGLRQRRKLSEAMTFYKSRRDWNGARVGLLFALMWWWAEAVTQTCRHRSIGPIAGYLRGLLDGARKPLLPHHGL